MPDPLPSHLPRFNRSVDADPSGGDARAAASHGRPGPAPPLRWTPLHWLGMGLFCLPFVVIPLTMLSALTLGGAGLVPLVPISFLGAFVGFALLVVATQRARRERREAGWPGRLADDVSAQGDGAEERIGAEAGGRRRGMRGDHPNAPSVDYPERFGNANAASSSAGVEGAAPIRCQHCGVWSVPIVERGARVCARCGAALPSS